MYNPDKINDTESIPLGFELDEQKEATLKLIKELLEKAPDILTAKVYGSWLYLEKSADLDLATIVPSKEGVIDSEVYEELRRLRQKITDKIEQDIDLVPHTEDELTDLRSPLYHPRYNPALTRGIDVKGKLDIRPSYNLGSEFKFADIAAYVLYDNRAICRRQLVRSLNATEGRIFVSKLLHGPGNALTYYSCRQNIEYISNPSNWPDSLQRLDTIFGVNSKSAIGFLHQCENGIGFNAGIKLLNWYEHLVALVLRGGESVMCYEICCQKLGTEAR